MRRQFPLCLIIAAGSRAWQLAVVGYTAQRRAHCGLVLPLNNRELNRFGCLHEEKEKRGGRKEKEAEPSAGRGSTCHRRSAENVRTRWGFYAFGMKKERREMGLLSCRCATNDGRRRMAAMQHVESMLWNRRCRCTVSRKGALCCCLQLSCCSWPWSRELHGPGDSSRGGNSDTLYWRPRVALLSRGFLCAIKVET